MKGMENGKIQSGRANWGEQFVTPFRWTLPAVALIALSGLVALPSTIRAADGVQLPPVNLGDTNFIDGPGYPGWFVEEFLDYYEAGHFDDDLGRTIAGSNKITIASTTTHVAYTTKYKLFGGYYGFEVLVPLVDIDARTSIGPNSRDRGIGDLTVSPFILQWDGQKVMGMPFFQRFDIPIDIPTGKYSDRHAVNIGNNIVTINPYYAFTIMFTDRLELSARLHYLWNSENDDPYTGLNAGSIQAGEAFHANYSVSYEVIKGLRVGFNGYVLQQFTDDKFNGNRQPGSEERVFGLGPGMLVTVKEWMVFVNGYFETGVDNRPAGSKVVLRLSKAF